MHPCNMRSKNVQLIFSAINPGSAWQSLRHPAEDIGTMGLLFAVRHDWSGVRFTAQIAETTWRTE